jgi:hypothetical protein
MGNVFAVDFRFIYLILHFQFLIIRRGAGVGCFRLGQGKAKAAKLGDEFQAGRNFVCPGDD